jgi:hypothetical protein
LTPYWFSCLFYIFNGYHSKKTHQPLAFKALMIIYSFGALSAILFFRAPGDFYADLRIPLQKL